MAPTSSASGSPWFSALYLWLAVLIFAAANAVTRRLTELGAMAAGPGQPNPISLCNVLFVGNLCALAVMVVVFRDARRRETRQQLSRADWWNLVAIAVLSGALGPALIFSALDSTNVTNVVLISRLEAPLTLVFSLWFLGAQVTAWTLAGAGVSFAGVVVTVLWAASSGPMMEMAGPLQIGRGEVFAAVGALVLAIATVFSKAKLERIPLGLFNLVRMGLGTVIFFGLAIALFGSDHFAEAFSPLLWQWMVLYGAVIIVAGQLCWFAGLRRASSAEISLANSINPIAAIAMAYLILGEVPTTAQWIGGSIILLGIGLNLVGSLRLKQRPPQSQTMTPAEQMEQITGFKGV